MTHFVIGGAVFLRGRGGVSTGAVRAVTAVTLAVQAESDRGTGRGQRSTTHRLTDGTHCHTAWHCTWMVGV